MARDKQRTGREAYEQLRWDTRLASLPFVIEIESRPEGTKRLAMGDFIPGGDIPWHRVRRILLGAEVVWSHRDHIDRIDQLASARPAAQTPPPAAPGAPPRAGAQGPAGLVSLSPARAASPAATPRDAALRVATWNVLFDLYDADLIDTARRTPAALRLLGEVDADLLGLTEVTPAFAAALAASPWARGFHRSDEADGPSLAPHGQLLLSRWPVRASAFLPLSGRRRALCCDVDAPSGSIRVVVVHLASNATEGAERLRRVDLERAIELLGPGRAALVGDFNLAEDEARDLLEGAGLRDPFRERFPDDPGHSYDPGRNALAALFSRDGRPRRYDRVLLRGGDPACCGARLFAADPVEGSLFASDHFGVQVDLRWGAGAPSLDAVDATYHAALVWLPEAPWGAIEALRARHDRGFGRWMPHVTLLYGFAPAQLFAEAFDRVARACREVEPFAVSLEASGRFDHGGSTTLWLDPRGGPLARLQAALQREFPRFNEQSQGGFTPHLTVARFPRARRDEAHDLERELRGSFSPLPCRVSEIHLLARRGERPFESVARFKLGTGQALSGLASVGQRDPWAALLPPDPAAARRRADALAAVTAVAAQAAADRGFLPPCVEPFGSARVCPEDPHGDLDLLLLSPAGLAAPEALAALRDGLSALGHPCRLAAEAAHPSLRTTVGGVDVDVLAAEFRAPGPPPPAASWPPAALAAAPPAERAALLGAADAEALERAVAPHRGRFSALLRVVKRWLDARALKAQWAGFPGGLAWAVLAARYCIDNPYNHGAQLIRGFFAWCEGWRWPAPVSLIEGDPERAGPMPVLAPASPARDLCRTVSEGTLSHLRAELRRAAEIADAVRRHQAAAGELFERASPPGDALRLAARGDEAERARQRGDIERGFLSTLRDLEAQGRQPRPYARWQRGPGEDTLAVGLAPAAAPQPARGR